MKQFLLLRDYCLKRDKKKLTCSKCGKRNFRQSAKQIVIGRSVFDSVSLYKFFC